MSLKICVVGAGAIGGWMAAKLAVAGHHVHVYARGDTLAAIRRQGLQLIEGDATLRVTVSASDQVDAAGSPDLLVLAVKAPALRDIAVHIRPMIGPSTLVLTAMNGVPWWFFQRDNRPLAGASLQSTDPSGEIATAFPAPQVLGCVVHAAASVDAPGIIRHKFGRGLIVGEPQGGHSGRAQRIVDALSAGGFEAKLSEDIQRDVWFKLWGNLTMNPVSMLTGATGDRILDDALVRNFCSMVMLEAQAIGNKIGIPIPSTPDERHAITRKLGAFKTSMLQDAESGKAIELDALVSAVREIGERVDVATPFIDALLGLARLHAQEKGLYRR
jgi:2-dehydropantoate 2-reductase